MRAGIDHWLLGGRNDGGPRPAGLEVGTKAGLHSVVRGREGWGPPRLGTDRSSGSSAGRAEVTRASRGRGAEFKEDLSVFFEEKRWVCELTGVISWREVCWYGVCGAGPPPAGSMAGC